MLKKPLMMPTAALIAVLTGCNVFTALNPAPTEAPTPTPTLAPTLTPATLAPTLALNTPVPTTPTAAGPTALPAPTQIGDAGAASPTAGTGAPTTAPVTGTPPTQAPTPTQPITSITDGIAIDPALGEPGDLIHVIGKGFAANEKLTFHWGAVSGANGPEYYTQNADGSGNFDVFLYVPKADKWPGGAPKERDLLQLRVVAPSLGFNHYFANFTYIKRFNAGTSLVQIANIEDYDYEIGLPNGWTWEWPEDADDEERHQENVRFYNPAGAEKGWIRVVETTDVNAAINTVLGLEGLTLSTKEQKTLGNFPGTEVKATNNRIIWFIAARNRVYALSFVNDSGGFYVEIGNSFKVK